MSSKRKSPPNKFEIDVTYAKTITRTAKAASAITQHVTATINTAVAAVNCDGFDSHVDQYKTDHQTSSEKVETLTSLQCAIENPNIDALFIAMDNPTSPAVTKTTIRTTINKINANNNNNNINVTNFTKTKSKIDAQSRTIDSNSNNKTNPVQQPIINNSSLNIEQLQTHLDFTQNIDVVIDEYNYLISCDENDNNKKGNEYENDENINSVHFNDDRSVVKTTVSTWNSTNTNIRTEDELCEDRIKKNKEKLASSKKSDNFEVGAALAPPPQKRAKTTYMSLSHDRNRDENGTEHNCVGIHELVEEGQGDIRCKFKSKNVKFLDTETRPTTVKTTVIPNRNVKETPTTEQAIAAINTNLITQHEAKRDEWIIKNQEDDNAEATKMEAIEKEQTTDAIKHLNRSICDEDLSDTAIYQDLSKIAAPALETTIPIESHSKIGSDCQTGNKSSIYKLATTATVVHTNFSGKTLNSNAPDENDSTCHSSGNNNNHSQNNNIYLSNNSGLEQATTATGASFSGTDCTIDVMVEPSINKKSINSLSVCPFPTNTKGSDCSLSMPPASPPMPAPLELHTNLLPMLMSVNEYSDELAQIYKTFHINASSTTSTTSEYLIGSSPKTTKSMEVTLDSASMDINKELNMSEIFKQLQIIRDRLLSTQTPSHYPELYPARSTSTRPAKKERKDCAWCNPQHDKKRRKTSLSCEKCQKFMCLEHGCMKKICVCHGCAAE